MNNKPLVRLKNISMIYHSLKGETEALKDISFDVFKGEFVSIVGPSGCGKTTILSIIAGLIKATSGNVLIEDKNIESPSSKVGYMLQQDHLFEWRNILQNVMLGLEIQNKQNEENIKKVKRLIKTYGLEDFKYHYPNELSGGMRQRVALIRTLAIDPSILLLDEPFSALDYQTRLTVSDEVARIIKKENKTAILVTHDIAEAISMSQRILVLTNRPATIKSEYDIKLTCNSDSPIERRQAKEFRKYFNIIWKDLDIHVQ